MQLLISRMGHVSENYYTFLYFRICYFIKKNVVIGERVRLRQTDGRRQRALEIQQQHEIRLQKQQYQSAANASRDETTQSSGAGCNIRGTRPKLRTLERARLRNVNSLQLNTELEQQEDNQHISHLDTGNILFISEYFTSWK